MADTAHVIGRRRKKSCIPHPNNPDICTECFGRGAECRDQQPDQLPKRPAPDSKQNLQQRVTELEAALQTLVSHGPMVPFPHGEVYIGSEGSHLLELQTTDLLQGFCILANIIADIDLLGQEARPSLGNISI